VRVAVAIWFAPVATPAAAGWSALLGEGAYGEAYRAYVRRTWF
jgi:hypothetical protein